jgi:hypothetical protein
LDIIATLSDSMSIAAAAGGGTELSIRFFLAEAPPSMPRLPPHSPESGIAG